MLPVVGENRPACVCILIHGTFARGAAWTEVDSTFRQQLARDLGASTIFKPFLWSGENSHAARLTAATELSQFVHASVREFPESSHILIAHSHGGNVALYALREQSTARVIAATVCMGTPFVCSEPRKWRTLFDGSAVAVWNMLLGFLCLPPILLTGFAIAGLTKGWMLAIFVDILYLSILLGIHRCAGFSKSIPRQIVIWLDAQEQALNRLLQLPSIPDGQLLIVYASGDEALWWLTRLTRWSNIPFIAWDTTWWLFKMGCVGMIFALWIAMLTRDSGRLDWFIGYFVGLVGLAIILLLQLVAMVCVPLFLRAHGIGFGGEEYTYNLVLRIRPRRFPGLHNSVNSYQCRFGLRRALRHSLIYRDNGTCGFIGQWIQTHIRTPAAAPSQASDSRQDDH